MRCDEWWPRSPDLRTGSIGQLEVQVSMLMGDSDERADFFARIRDDVERMS